MLCWSVASVAVKPARFCGVLACMHLPWWTALIPRASSVISARSIGKSLISEETPSATYRLAYQLAQGVSSRPHELSIRAHTVASMRCSTERHETKSIHSTNSQSGLLFVTYLVVILGCLAMLERACNILMMGDSYRMILP